MVRMPGSSPPSSEATHYGTPSTNITAMSPDACNSSGRVGNAPRFNLRINTNQPRSATRGHRMPRNLHLPRVDSTQLSPTAEEFTPRTANFNIPPHMASFRSQGVSPVRNLVVGSMPDFYNAQPTVHGAIGQASAVMTVTNINTGVQLGPNINVVWGTFSTDENVTRTFQIFDKNGPSLHHIIHRFPTQFDTLACIDSKHIEHGIIRLSFHDDRDAKQAYVLAASLTHPRCDLTQLTAKDVAVAHGRDPSSVTNYEGQLLVTLMFDSRSVLPLLPQLYEKLAVFGHVKAIVSFTSTIMNTIAFRVEYSNVLQAKQAAKYLPQASQGNIQYSVTLYEPDIFHRTQRSAPTSITPRRNNGHPSLTGRSTIPSGDFARLENVMARIMREPPSPYRGVARIGHNVVDIIRIEAGLDVRTTIMLRNIPNRVDQDALKDLLDRTSFGEFDFMYLRIDFANNCNVGYAFINFVDPLAIVAFARARAGKRWNIFSSDKVAEISYATIQGRDCLIQKFRNSSVMLEHPTYRPKLYYTHPSLSAGTEETFPEPDNYSKMRRSIDNAEHVGLYRPNQDNGRRAAPPAYTQEPNTSNRSSTSTPLTWSSSTTSSSTNSGLFAPREGQAHREEQRRRRSQFDRGTPGAEIELSSYRLTDAAFDGPHPRLAPAAHIGGMPVEDPASAASRLALQGLRFF